ncbi:unnamed protein product [Rotaria sordida]|uniref:Uncharacterized protein n=1 Tax=Rotaria sordida TaxID=392033 RepID=A0A814IM05_9BILA|nr:unnamed protein product [Rotaria sordida]CAF1331019.1 unnamed protein product [Rotaria sordida]
MHVLTTFIVFLLILQGTFAANCECHCCTSSRCEPQLVGSSPIWFCTAQTCRPELCIDSYHDRCPPQGALGTTIAKCSGMKQLPSPLFIIIGITSIILMIKNKF